MFIINMNTHYGSIDQKLKDFSDAIEGQSNIIPFFEEVQKIAMAIAEEFEKWNKARNDQEELDEPEDPVPAIDEEVIEHQRPPIDPSTESYFETPDEASQNALSLREQVENRHKLVVDLHHPDCGPQESLCAREEGVLGEVPIVAA